MRVGFRGAVRYGPGAEQDERSVHFGDVVPAVHPARPDPDDRAPLKAVADEIYRSAHPPVQRADFQVLAIVGSGQGTVKQIGTAAAQL